jgi:hypothetical protein
MPDQKAESGLIVNWDDIPDSGIVPSGYYQVGIDALEAKFSKTKHTLMYQGTFIVQEPQEYTNYYIFDWFPLGTEEDPNAQDPELRKRSFGFQKLKGLFKALDIGLDPSLDRMCRQAEGQIVMMKMTLGKDRETNNDRNQVSRYMALGEREPGLDDSDRGGRITSMKSHPGKSFHDAGDDAPAMANGADTTATARPPATAARPPAATPRAVAPARPRAAAQVVEEGDSVAPAAEAKPKAAAKIEVKNCPLCSKPFPISGPNDLRSHMNVCGIDTAGTDNPAA